MSEQPPQTSSPATGPRSIDLTRIGEGRYKATNARGGLVPIGSGHDPDFSPVELLLAGLAGCSAIDVDLITGKRADPVSFDVRADGVKVRDEQGNHMTDFRVTFDVRFPASDEGDAARAVLQRSIDQTRDRLCSVGRTIALGAPVEYAQEDLNRG